MISIFKLNRPFSIPGRNDLGGLISQKMRGEFQPKSGFAHFAHFLSYMYNHLWAEVGAGNTNYQSMWDSGEKRKVLV